MCSAAVHVVEGEVVATTGGHTHDADPLVRKAAEMRQDAKNAAKASESRQKAIGGAVNVFSIINPTDSGNCQAIVRLVNLVGTIQAFSKILPESCTETYLKSSITFEAPCIVSENISVRDIVTCSHSFPKVNFGAGPTALGLPTYHHISFLNIYKLFVRLAEPSFL